MAINKFVYNGAVKFDLTEDTVTQADVLAGVTYHGADGESSVGAMVNRGAVSGSLGSADDFYTIPNGYHNGKGTVEISSIEKAKLKNSGNIKKGVTIMGTLGSYEGEAISLQEKSVIPSASSQVITADVGYDGLSRVTVSGIQYTEEENHAGGITVTIG